MGVPLIDKEKMEAIWKSQERHVQCIQDPPNYNLYTQTRTIVKGGVRLPTYRCARGSTSLESFHRHLATFIPGQSASDLHFQAYLLEGLRRWNEDRAVAAETEGRSEVPTQTYSAILRHTANTLGQNVYGAPVDPSFQQPRKYTGESIGVEYLYQQTGKVLQDYKEDLDLPSQEDEDDDDADEGFVDVAEDDQTVSPLVTQPLPASMSRRTPTPPAPRTPSPLPPRAQTPPPPRSQTPPAPRIPTPPVVTSQGTKITSILRIPEQSEMEVISRTSLCTDPGFGLLPPMGGTAWRSSSPTLQLTPMPPLLQSSSPRQSPSPSPRESASQVQRMSVSTSSSSSSRQSLSPREQSTESDSADSDYSVGPDNIPGYDKVQDLADFLVKHRDDTFLSNTQVILLIRKWRLLDDYDKQPIVFPSRHKERLTTGRFKARGKSAVPGVDSTKRCFLGQNTGPATWPYCNRYVEVIIIKLCDIYPRNTRSPQGELVLGWTLVSRSYSKIRQLVLSNARVMAETQIQLQQLNNAFITQWFHRRSKRQEREVLQQGITLPTPPLTASQPLPPPSQQRPSEIVSQQEPHQFVLPENTAGKANVRKKRGDKSSTRI